jgi:hypothetical protein
MCARMRGVLFSALIGTLVAYAASAQPITCPSPPSTTDVERNLEVGAKASLLSRFLDMFSADYKQRTAIRQNLSQLPNADELFKHLNFMSQKCHTIMAMRVPDDVKLRAWSDFIDQMANYHPPDPNVPSPDPPPLAPRRVPPVIELQKPPIIGSWETKFLSNNIPYTMVYTFYPDGSFLSSSVTGGNKLDTRGRFQYQHGRGGHVLIELNDGAFEYAALDMMENQFRYRIVDHSNQAAIGHEVIFRRLRR